MDKGCKLSVVTITYNDYEGLYRTLESLSHQTEIESIVINGGDCERTRNFLSQHFGKVVNEKDEGIADAFNKGIRWATGEAISFLNSGDVLLDREFYTKAMTILLKNPDVGIVHSDLLFQDAVAGSLLLRYQNIKLGRGQPFLHPTMVVRSSLFKSIGGFNTKYKIAMDFDHIVRMFKAGIKHRHLPGPVVIMDGTGTSTRKEWASIMECIKSLKENGLLGPGNILGIIERIFYYLGRRLLQIFGATVLLTRLKHKKLRTR